MVDLVKVMRMIKKPKKANGFFENPNDNENDNENDNDNGNGIYMNINKLIEYIEQNFRKTLYRMDYEILEDIEKANYTEQQIKDAIAYCIEHNTDSIRYLQRVLQNTKIEVSKKTSWYEIQDEIKTVPLSAEERKEMEKLLKPFMED